MEPMVLMLMEKDRETGLLSREIGSYTITEHGNLVSGIYLMHEDQRDMVYLRLTTDRDVEDWEYSAIFDYYDTDAMKEMVLSIEELDDYNPVWEVSFPWGDSQEAMENLLAKILEKHRNLLNAVYNAIQDKKAEYEDHA